MATNKKHIAVYLDPLVEQALTAFCEEKGLISKKGCMYSTGVNAVLAEFFGIADTHSINLETSLSSKTLAAISNIRAAMSNIPSLDTIQSAVRSANNLAAMSNIPSLDAIQSMTRSVSNIQSAISNIDTLASSISAADASNILPQSIGVESFPETTRVSDVEVDLLIQELEAIRAENQRLQTELGKSDSEKESLKQEVAEVRSQLETERADREEVEAKLTDRETQIAELRSELKGAQATIVAQRDKIHNLERGYGHKPTPTEGILRRQLSELQTELSDLKQKSATAEKDLPEADLIEKAGELLNLFKSLLPPKAKLPSGTISKIEKILEDGDEH